MNVGIAFILLIIVVPLLLILLFVLAYVIADGVVSSSYGKTSETTLFIQSLTSKLKKKFQ